MRRSTIPIQIATMVLISSILCHIVQITDSESNEPGWGFVVGTCWPQIYDSNECARMEKLLIDSDQEREMLDAIRKFWQNAESEKPSNKCSP